jgi:hypothetical protein
MPKARVILNEVKNHVYGEQKAAGGAALATG